MFFSIFIHFVKFKNVDMVSVFQKFLEIKLRVTQQNISYKFKHS